MDLKNLYTEILDAMNAKLSLFFIEDYSTVIALNPTYIRLVTYDGKEVVRVFFDKYALVLKESGYEIMVF
ncbi:hypothetical protein [Sulfolobus ellipsoid virus 1]|uniref:Uncharacterized protein n=1 Tax=Sulfolobus ellipsoid virus 1 TaxID=2056194 RepID=A0A2H4RBP1_9VIRU|nr:hypothetical protein FGG62_gp06 [Sulfolobus ellipsoid virus 1]ATY46484.1 hypothetical protein [Sulfolobus ellipsoid virus 1]